MADLLSDPQFAFVLANAKSVGNVFNGIRMDEVLAAERAARLAAEGKIADMRTEHSYVHGHNAGFADAKAQFGGDFEARVKAETKLGELEARFAAAERNVELLTADNAAEQALREAAVRHFEIAEAALAEARESALRAQGHLVSGMDKGNLPALQSAVSYALSHLSLITPSSQPPERVEGERVQRLQAALEGELDGLAIDDATAAVVLAYVDGDDDAPSRAPAQKDTP